MKAPDADRWHKAANDEMMSLTSNGTWELVDLPPGQKAIGSGWVFKVKRNADGSARIVAKGFSQRPGIDYTEVFAPTTCLEKLRLILSLLAHRGWVGRQLDIKSAFLNSLLTEPIYMAQPEGYVDPEHPDWVLELNKALYGLKQSPRLWNKELHSVLVTFGLTQSAHDPTLYYRIQSGKLVGAVTVHVDDMCIVGESTFVNHATNLCLIQSRFG